MSCKSNTQGPLYASSSFPHWGHLTKLSNDFVHFQALALRSWVGVVGGTI